MAGWAVSSHPKRNGMAIVLVNLTLVLCHRNTKSKQKESNGKVSALKAVFDYFILLWGLGGQGTMKFEWISFAAAEALIKLSITKYA